MILPVLIAAFVAEVSAAPLNIEATTDKTRLSMGEVLTLSIKVSGEIAGSLPSPSAPSHDGFNIAGAPMQSSSFSWINGRVSSSKTINYTLVPHVEGTFSIGESLIRYNGQEYRSEPVQVTVDGLPKPTAGAEGEAGDLSRMSADPYGRIMVSAKLSKNEVYLGEGVVYTFSFFRKVRLWETPNYSPPNFTDFWSEDLPVRQKEREVIVKGQKYLRHDIKKVLFPTREGTLKIGSTSISAQIDPFARPVTLTTKPLKMEVLPLPEAPGGFSGAVGNYTITAEADHLKGKEGEPISVKVALAGIGNIKALAPPSYEESEFFRGYEPKDSMDISTLNDMISGTKTFEFLFIPLAAGEVNLPSFSFTFFDTSDNQYRTLSTKEISLRIEKTEGFKAAGGVSPSSFMESDRLIKKSLRPIRTKSKLANWNPRNYRRRTYLAFYFLPPLLLLLLVVQRKLSARQEKAGRGYKQAMALVKEAEGRINDGDYKAFFSSADSALNDYLADAFALPAASSPKDEIVTVLAASSCPRELRERIEKAFNKADLGRFSPTRYGEEEMTAFLSEVEAIIKVLEENRFWEGSK